jgi:beta-lactamase class A
VERLDCKDAEATLEAAGLGGASLVVVALGAASARQLLSLRGAAGLSPASMIKIPIAAALAARWETGAASPDDRVEVAARNMTANDAPSPLEPGYVATLDELGRLMLERSDNVATNQLLDVLGREAVTQYCAAFGLNGTHVRRKLSGSVPLIDDPGAAGRNAHPPADAAALLTMIALDRVPGAAWLRDALSRQYWNGKLSTGLAPGDRFAHKTGDTDEVSHDGGILMTTEGHAYTVVVYAGSASPDGDDPRFTALMRALRPLL